MAGWRESRGPGLSGHPAGVVRRGGTVLVPAHVVASGAGSHPAVRPDPAATGPAPAGAVATHRRRGRPGAEELDLASDDREAEVAWHVELGGRVVRNTVNWTTLLDPSGRAYCVTRRSPVSGTLP
ncbi:MAG: VOC family protein [Actinomycetales bacterium]